MNAGTTTNEKGITGERMLVPWRENAAVTMPREGTPFKRRYLQTESKQNNHWTKRKHAEAFPKYVTENSERKGEDGR